MPNPVRAAVLLTLLACAACAASGTSTQGSSGTASPSRTRGSSTLITQQEVQESQARNAYDLVQFLRPTWLQKRGAVGLAQDGNIIVYVDDNRMGGTESLRQIEKTAIHSIRFHDAVSAQARFGMNHPYGAIQVVTDRS